MESDWPLARAFLENHPYEAGLVLEKFAASESAELLREIPEQVTASVLEQMVSSSGAACLSALPGEFAGRILEMVSLDHAARMLRCAAPEERRRLLAVCSERRSVPLRRLLDYPPGTAGSLMDPQVLALPESLSLRDALDRVQRSPQHTLYYLYVVDAEQRLAGVMNLRELMLAASDEPLSTAMRDNVESLPASAALPAILLHPAWREFHALPVVDGEKRFLGAIRYKALKRLEQESHRKPTDNESMTALLSLGELCWIGFAGMLTGLAATVFPQTLSARKSQETSDGASE